MNPKDASRSRLDERIDAALLSWPLPERSPAAWETMANRIDAALDTPSGSPDDAAALVEPPLPATPREVRESAPPAGLNVGSANRNAAAPGETKMSQPPDRGRDRRSLQDLAKLASAPSLTPTPPPSTSKPPASAGKVASVSPMATTRRSDPGDSGVVDLKLMAQFDPEAAERAKETKLASAELFDDEPAGSEAAPASSKAPATEKAAPSGRVREAAPSSGKAVGAKAGPSSSPSTSTASAAAQARPAPAASEEKTSSVVWIGGVAALFAAAAAAVFMLQSQGSAPTADNSVPTTPVAATAAPPPSKPVAPATSSAVAVADNPAPPEQGGVDPATLPVEGKQANPATKAVAAGPKKNVVLPGVASAPVEPPKAEPVKPNPALEAKIPMGPNESGALDKALRQAAGPTDTPSGGGTSTSPSGPQFDPGSVPQKPSAGAITSGVASAMSQARSCLGLDDPISRAAVTFDSSGVVKDVVVSGYAAGKPAEACIKSALKNAKVPPFAQPIYTQIFTVRPNS